MKTMYKAEIEKYTDLEGRYTDYAMKDTYQPTLEEAKALVENTKRSFPFTGSYRVVAVTMDEATFTYKEEVVYTFNYWKEVGLW